MKAIAYMRYWRSLRKTSDTRHHLFLLSALINKAYRFISYLSKHTLLSYAILRFFHLYTNNPVHFMTFSQTINIKYIHCLYLSVIFLFLAVAGYLPDNYIRVFVLEHSVSWQSEPNDRLAVGTEDRIFPINKKPMNRVWC